MAETTMHARNAISGALGRAYVTINGERKLWASLINLEANASKTKTQVPIMGRASKGNKATGIEYSGSATFHYNSSVFRELLLNLQDNGEDVYFDIQVTNDDKTSTVGMQTVVLKDCNIDGGIIASLDADSDYLEDSFDFTFESFQLPAQFTNEAGTM